jgi:outer membrane protein assembly factor BamB
MVKILWSVDFVKEYESTRPRWGYATSPLLIDGMVIMEVGGQKDHGFAAFDKTSGAVLWHSGNVVSGYNSAVMAKAEGNKIIIFVNGSMLYAFDKDGNSLWTYAMPLRSPMALPLFIEPDLLFVSAANDAGSFILRISGQSPEEVMRASVMRNDWSSSSYKDGYIYGFNVATLQCIDAQSGQRKWLKRGFGKGSLILVNDRLIILSDLGTLTLAEATPDGYREIAVVEALQGRSWTAPSYANGNLYIRNHTHIACYRIMEHNEKQKMSGQKIP